MEGVLSPHLAVAQPADDAADNYCESHHKANRRNRDMTALVHEEKVEETRHSQRFRHHCTRENEDNLDCAMYPSGTLKLDYRIHPVSQSGSNIPRIPTHPQNLITKEEKRGVVSSESIFFCRCGCWGGDCDMDTCRYCCYCACYQY